MSQSVEEHKESDISQIREKISQNPSFINSYEAYYPRPVNEADKTLLDLGIGEGHLVLPLLFAGWKITGYDINPDALTYLNRCFQPEVSDKSFRIKPNNLNDIGLHDTELLADLQNSKNVVMINVAPFLEDASLIHLLYTLMDHAQPDTTFFFCCAYMPKIKEVKRSREFLALPMNYISSFFGCRTDMKSIFHEQTQFGRCHNDVFIAQKY